MQEYPFLIQLVWFKEQGGGTMPKNMGNWDRAIRILVALLFVYLYRVASGCCCWWLASSSWWRAWWVFVRCTKSSISVHAKP